MTVPISPFTLATWRHTVAELYATVRRAGAEERQETWEWFRKERLVLFKEHPDSPLLDEKRERFEDLNYYPYQPGWRVIGELDTGVPQETFEVDLQEEDILRYTRVARVNFSQAGIACSLSVFWIEGYGGGLFLPFRDRTSGCTTYGGGRYLYDTIKGADLGVTKDTMVLDFNYAYNPSCAYNPSWVCPLAPTGNRLPIAVEAGEIIAEDF